MAVATPGRGLTPAPELPPVARVALTAQAAYYVATGLWPLLHMASFEAVTGPKTDDWLVHMVALLVLVIGLTLAAAVHTGRWGLEIRMLAIGGALAFAAIEIWYVFTGRISPIYLADTLPELLLAGVLASQLHPRRTPQ